MRVLPSIALLIMATSVATAGQIQWHQDLRQAHAIAQKENKPLLLHFTTDNCVYCDRLEAGAFQSAEVQSAIAGGYVPVKIHAGQQPQLAKMFKVSRFPTDVIVTTSGEALVHQVSPQEPIQYTAMLGTAAGAIAASNPSSAPTPTSPPAVEVAQTSAIGDNGAGFELPVTTAAQTVSRRNAGMPLPPLPSNTTAAKQTPSVSAAQAAVAPVATARVEAASNPTLALDGYCSVSVVQDATWVQGSPEFGVVHLGQLYLFTDQQKMEAFLDNPVPYTPMLNGIDVVRFFEERKIVPGKREFSAVDPDHNRVFLFADEDALTHFENTFERYVDSAIAVMDKAVTESNP